MTRGAVSIIVNRIIEGTWYYKSEAEKLLAERKAETLRLSLEKQMDTPIVTAYMETDRTDMFA